MAIIIVDNILGPWRYFTTIYDSLNNYSEYRYNDRFFVILNDNNKTKNHEGCQQIIAQYPNATFEISYHKGDNPPDTCALPEKLIGEISRSNNVVKICSFHHQNNDDVWNIIVKKCMEIGNEIQQ